LQRKFTHIDESFVCIICGTKIPTLNYTARNHCRECLCSIHLDNFPGDRQSECGGIMRPIGIEPHKKKAGVMQLLHKCEKCGEIRKNIVAEDDDYDLILKLSAKKAYEI